MRGKSKTLEIKDRRGKTIATAKIEFHPDPHGDLKLSALLVLLGYSDAEINSIIEERQIKRAEQADSTEG